jgi:hypothetical protein
MLSVLWCGWKKFFTAPGYTCTYKSNRNIAEGMFLGEQKDQEKTAPKNIK